MPARNFHFVQLDVFTTRPLEGNQLAVFSDARGLSDEEMQKLARETNLSETTYILPRESSVEQREGHKVRIFTVNEEYHVGILLNSSGFTKVRQLRAFCPTALLHRTA